jgi:hypothetical protein
VWDAIGREGNAWVTPMIVGTLGALAVLAVSAFSPRKARRAGLAPTP